VTVSEDWPVALRGITESIVTTLGPNERWNVAALGLDANTEQAVTARTWGRTRTWRNFAGRGEGYIQFTCDPELFVDAALSIHEVDDPVLPEADAWVQVETEQIAQGEEGGTQWVEWSLSPVDQRIEQRVVPTFNRGYAAVIEATVHASRLDVDAYDTETLRQRIEYCESVVERCGGATEQRAIERVIDIVDDRM